MWKWMWMWMSRTGGCTEEFQSQPVLENLGSCRSSQCGHLKRGLRRPGRLAQQRKSETPLNPGFSPQDTATSWYRTTDKQK